MQLKDKVIIITGGCQGLGRAMAEYLAAKGTKLALVDLNPEKLELAVQPARRTASRPEPTCATSLTKNRLRKPLAKLQKILVRSTAWSTTPAFCVTACCSRSRMAL